MRRFLAGCTSLAVALMPAGQAFAYTTRVTQTTAVTGSGVTESTSFTTSVVDQGTADVASPLDFGTGGNAFRDSGEAIKVNVSTNLAANRVIISTDNLNVSASPKCTLNTELGNDCGGLIGVTDTKQVVPVLWVVADTNIDHAFTTGTIGDDEVFVTDRAHVSTYVDAVLFGALPAEKQKLDILAMKRCDNGTPVANADNTDRKSV